MEHYYHVFTIAIDILIGLSAICISICFVGLFLYGIFILTEMRK